MSGRTVRFLTQTKSRPNAQPQALADRLDVNRAISEDGKVATNKWDRARTIIPRGRNVAFMNGDYAQMKDNSINPAKVGKFRNKPTMRVDMDSGYFTPIRAFRPVQDRSRKEVARRYKLNVGKDKTSILASTLREEDGMMQPVGGSLAFVGRSIFNIKDGKRTDLRPRYEAYQFKEYDSQGYPITYVPFVRSSKVTKEATKAIERYKISGNAIQSSREYYYPDRKEITPIRKDKSLMRSYRSTLEDKSFDHIRSNTGNMKAINKSSQVRSVSGIRPTTSIPGVGKRFQLKKDIDLTPKESVLSKKGEGFMKGNSVPFRRKGKVDKVIHKATIDTTATGKQLGSTSISSNTVRQIGNTNAVQMKSEFSAPSKLFTRPNQFGRNLNRRVFEPARDSSLAFM